MAPKVVALVTCVALALAGCTSGSGTEPETPMRQDDGLLARLRNGGLTIVIRHAATDRSQPDAPTVVLDDCATQRNLTDKGRADARAIGDAVDRLDIPVGEIWASPYCRSRDTAELAFRRFEIVPGLERLYPERDERADRRLNQLIREQAPRTGESNLVIASHGVYPSVLTPAVPLGEGEAALYTRVHNGFELVDRIEPSEWAALSTDADSGAARTADSVVTLNGPGGTGSAFRVAVPGILVTSAHLVVGVDEVAVTLPDGEQRTARVLGRDPEVDRAFAIGPDGVGASGSIRALRDPTTTRGGGQLSAVRIDADVPRDSVGGPLVNDDGDVLGVLTLALKIVRDS